MYDIFHKTRTDNPKINNVTAEDPQNAKVILRQKKSWRYYAFLTSDYTTKLQLWKQHGTETKTYISPCGTEQRAQKQTHLLTVI